MALSCMSKCTRVFVYVCVYTHGHYTRAHTYIYICRYIHVYGVIITEAVASTVSTSVGFGTRLQGTSASQNLCLIVSSKVLSPGTLFWKRGLFTSSGVLVKAIGVLLGK